MPADDDRCLHLFAPLFEGSFPSLLVELFPLTFAGFPEPFRLGGFFFRRDLPDAIEGLRLVQVLVRDLALVVDKNSAAVVVDVLVDRLAVQRRQQAEYYQQNRNGHALHDPCSLIWSRLRRAFF